MGSVLTPALIGVEAAGHLPNASSLCGRCESVCPMRIPLPRMLRAWRTREFEMGKSPAAFRYGIRMWSWWARRPALYHFFANLKTRALGWKGRNKGRFGWLPFAGGWTRHRDMPAPQGKTFQQLWRERQR